MAIRIKQRGEGYGLAILDNLIQIANNENCTKILLEPTHAQGLYLKRVSRRFGSARKMGFPWM
jgi:hypothetical protein